MKIKLKKAQQHIMTGIGYMIPIIVTASIVTGMVQLFAAMLGWQISTPESLESANAMLRCFAWIKQVAAPQCQDLMYPFLGGFIAYSISDRQGLTAGFFGGLLAKLSGSGFFGAVIIGFVSGYVMKWLIENLTVPRKYRSVMNMMIYPLIGTSVVFLFSFFIINPAGLWLNKTIQAFITSIGQYGEIPLVGVIASAMAFDVGGPINKAGFSVGYALAGTGFSKLPVSFGAMIAPLGFGLAVILSNMLFKKKALFDDNLEGAGYPALILGLFNVTEGALPMLLADPIAMIPINIIGSASGAMLAHAMGNFLPIERAGNVLGFFLQENPLLYMFCLFFGALIVATLTILRRMQLKAKADRLAVEA